MRKNIFVAMMFLVVFMATQAMAVTFPTLDEHTLVSSDGNGIVTVKANGESGWSLVQYCQDNMRAGCGNNAVIKPLEDSAGTMKFQLDDYGMKYGQVAFNFMKDGAWLAIPDCRVKTANQVSMGMSYKVSDIPNSGGAHFVYTGSGGTVWSPVDSSEWCEGKVAKVAPRAKITHAYVSNAPRATAGVGVNNNSPASQAVGAINKNSSGNTAGDEVVGSPMNVVVKVGTCGGKKLKKGETCQSGHVVNVYAVKHGDTNVSMKGHVVKNNTFKEKAFIYNAPVYNYHGGKSGYTDCNKCHNPADWKNHQQDIEARSLFFKMMTSSSKKK